MQEVLKDIYICIRRNYSTNQFKYTVSKWQTTMTSNFIIKYLIWLYKTYFSETTTWPGSTRLTNVNVLNQVYLSHERHLCSLFWSWSGAVQSIKMHLKYKLPAQQQYIKSLGMQAGQHLYKLHCTILYCTFWHPVLIASIKNVTCVCPCVKLDKANYLLLPMHVPWVLTGLSSDHFWQVLTD